MNTNRTEFHESVLLELYLIETATPNFRSTTSTIIDVRSQSDFDRLHGSGGSTSDEDVNALKDSLVPLIFGAAWKVIDLIIEFSLYQAGHSKNIQRIEFKKDQANIGIENHLIKDCEPISWNLMLKAYAATVEHRHALVHRKAHIDSFGNLHASSKQGEPLIILKRSEQIYFSKAAYILAHSVVEGNMDRRTNEAVKYYLSGLSEHTSQAVACRPPNAPIIFKMSLTRENGGLCLDVGAAFTRTGLSPEKHYINLHIDIPGDDQNTLFAFAEDCPLEPTVIDLSALPSWLALKIL